MITKEEFIVRLSQCDVHLLQETLFRAQIETKLDTPNQCASLIADSLWERAQTIWEKSIAPKSLDDIVDHYLERLEIEANGNAWEKLDSLLLDVLPENSVISIEEIPKEVQDDLLRSPWIDKLSAGGGPMSLLTSFLSKFISGQLSRVPLWLLRFIPWIGPKIILIRNAANIVATVTGPLGVAISLWAIYRHLGPKWDQALPLLLGTAIAIRYNSQITPIEV
jgi:hypothetical protein